MVVTRFAPSPTGFLHIGGIRTALYAYALAKQQGGKFILRIEDTDMPRTVEGGEADIEAMLLAYGLPWDEKFKQSERLEIYKKFANELIEKGEAYYCFSSKEEIEKIRNEGKAINKNFIFRSPYRDLSLDEAKKLVAEGKPYVIRQKLPENYVVVFDDPVQGTMSFNTNDLDETVLLKTDGFPTYHLAMAVDDHLMGVTDVFRGVEWLPSVPKHVLLYKAFGWEVPVITHLPVILDPEGGKLSKRRGAVSAKGFLEEGYLPEAVLNFLMLLGWSAPIKYEHGAKEQEFFHLKDFVEMFAMHDLNKASPVFNREKLIWFNQKYIQALAPDALVAEFTKWLATKPELQELRDAIIKAGPDQVEKMLLLEQTRVKTLSEFPTAISFFFNYHGGIDLLDSKQTKKLELSTAKDFIRTFVEFLKQFSADFEDFNHEQWEEFVRNYAEEKQQKAGGLFMVLRLAITDSQFSPPLFEVIKILGKDEVTRRLQSYLD